MANFDYKSFLANTPQKPGVYVMKDTDGQILYIGKAKKLRNRLASYFHKNQLSEKTLTLVSQIDHIELNITHTEVEALILEYNLVNKHQPKYNILLKDGKNFIYIYLSDDEFPLIYYQHGDKNGKGKSFGPYPSAFSAKQAVLHLQKIFRIRDCSNSYFKNRTRPCLQYQIDKCSGPCVGKIAREDYLADIKLCEAMLKGKNEQVMTTLAEKMDQAARDLNYELAAKYRDQIISLRAINEKQYVSKSQGDVDVIALEREAGLCCISVCYIRQGKNLGFRHFFPQLKGDESRQEVMNAFLSSYYMRHPAPKEIVLPAQSSEQALIEALVEHNESKKVHFVVPQKGEKYQWLKLTQENARNELARKLLSKSSYQKRLQAMQTLLLLDKLPRQIECFDISHTFGESTVASCVVFNAEGADKKSWRRFNIKDIEPGDDYAAMKQALTRRYQRQTREANKLPDVLLIDGGKGQLSQAREVLQNLNIIDCIALVGVAKGPERIAGEETLIIDKTHQEIRCDRHNPGFHLIQQIRDEAHRFAISGHRGQRAKKRKQSLLQSIPGLGPKRRQALLKYFGGLQGIAKAREEELSKVNGISKVLASLIYQKLHAEKQ